METNPGADPVVIIGGGHAGVQTAARLAELGYAGGIVLVDQEGGLPYERPPLSKEMLGTDATPDPPLLRRESFYATKGIELHRGDQAVAIRRDRRVVELESGRELPYGRMVLATGSAPCTLPLPGADLPGIALLKTAADAARLRTALSPGRRLVVIGAGYIGLEVAAAARSAGCAVTLVEGRDRVLARVTSEPVSRFFQDLHTAAGVELVLGTSVERFEGAERVERVVTTGGTVHAADAVVVGVGVRPHQALAEAAGLACADGVLVDDCARTSDPSIYAVGDVARTVSPDDPAGTRLESVQNAVAQALAAARHIAVGERTGPEVPWFWTVQYGVRLQTAGLRRDDDEIVLRGDPTSGRFSVLYLRNGRLAAIDTIGSLKDFLPAKKLIAADAHLDRSAAADPDVKLSRVNQQAA